MQVVRGCKPLLNVAYACDKPGLNTESSAINNSQGEPKMKTATQAGWCLSTSEDNSDKYAFVYNPKTGERFECFVNQYNLIQSKGDLDLYDCPLSVVKLIHLWFEFGEYAVFA